MKFTLESEGVLQAAVAGIPRVASTIAGIPSGFANEHWKPGKQCRSLREIDRRRSVLGEKLRHSMQEIEERELKLIETTPGKGKDAANRKIKTNRANARVSTGPKTHRGRARSARNAFRHGLSMPVESDQVLSERVQALTRQIAGSDTSVHIQILAHRIAEAQIDLLRVRYARHRLLLEKFSNYLSPAIMRKKLRAVAFGADTPLPSDMIKYLDSKPEGP